MPTNPDLAALSAAATPGEWRTVGRIGLTIRCGEGWIGKANWRNGKENAAFITALVNAYRTGNLIQIDREGMRERCRDAIASCLGDDYAMVPKNKMEWVKARGMCGGFPRDINAPFQCDYDAAADATIAAILGKKL